MIDRHKLIKTISEFRWRGQATYESGSALLIQDVLRLATRIAADQEEPPSDDER